MDWICVAAGAVVLVAVVLYVVSRSRHYGKLYSPAHVAEFCQGIGRLKPVVLERIESEDSLRGTPLTPEDPRILRTSGGLLLVYTISADGGVYRHHFSIQDLQGYTAGAVGQTFLVLTAMVLGHDVAALGLERSERAIYHAEIELDEAGQRAFAERPPTAVTEANAGELWAEAMRKGEGVRVVHTVVKVS